MVYAKATTQGPKNNQIINQLIKINDPIKNHMNNQSVRTK